MPSEAWRLLTPAEQFERIEAFGMYERGLIARVQGLQAPVAEVKPAQPKPLRLKVNPYEGEEGENLHFWVREVEFAMDAALISTERLRIAFALSNLEGRAKTWAYTREAITPGCFTTWAQLCEQFGTTFLSAKEPIPENIKVTLFMDILKVGPSPTQLFRVHANTMEVVIQIALQEEYSHRQARTPTS
ncbi:Gag protein, partial [Phytophthora palmivora]